MRDLLEDNEIEQEFRKIENNLKKLEFFSFFTDEVDKRNVILSIHPGAGGTESCDWADMLFRMYKRFFERKGWKYNILDYQPGEEAGIKGVSIEVIGDYAYGHLKSEHGIHRLVRVSPFDAGNRRHTSFAAVSVLPEMEDVEVEIKEDEIRIDTFRASGHGGQHVNKTSSAVRITHIPTGIVVQCQNERSQYQNKLNAMKILRARLYEFYKKERDKKMENYRSRDDIAWGHQIRSYVLFPYKLIKDHRTNYEETNVDKVLDGEIDEFIYMYLLKNISKKHK